jgi:hypothetical protein
MKTKSVFFCSLFLVFLLFSVSSLFSQEYPCNSCGGTGTQTCIRCGGSGTYTCPNCGGNGGTWETCNCNNGVVNMPDGTQQVCNYCKGEGRVWHSCFNPLCNNGIVTCDFCGGQGQKICPSCNGTGKR